METAETKKQITQGEWKAVEAIDQMQFEETTVCRVSRDWWISTTAEENGNTEANAKLLAAAPDLLKALEGLVSEITQEGYPLHSGMTVIWIDKAKAAIKKATLCQ